MCIRSSIKPITINSSDEEAWNNLWKLYADMNVSKENELLCDYHSGVNGGGHHCFFDNCRECEELISILNSLLPKTFFDTINKAYSAYLKDKRVTALCDKADRYFYKNEQIIVDILLQKARELSSEYNN